jgi:hypothetical protein
MSKVIVENRESPLEAVIKKQARELAKMLDEGLNGGREVPTIGFSLLIFWFGDQPQPTTWISNAQREDMIRVVEEWLRVMKSRA